MGIVYYLNRVQHPIIVWGLKNLEMLFWIGGLAFLGCSTLEESHISICPVNFVLGIQCPGCGLGHSISWILQGEFAQSWEEHKLGGPALAIILFRIQKLITLAIKPINPYGQPKQ
jgi:hypothetical protein